jgi:hypothetical protein
MVSPAEKHHMSVNSTEEVPVDRQGNGIFLG